jgi:UDP-glucose 4-epimerase
MTGQRVAVVGGAGRLGRYIVEELAPFHDVLVLDRNAFSGPEPSQIVDIMALDELRAAFRDVGAVIHVAGIDGHVQTTPEMFYKTNVIGTWNVLQAASEAGIRKVVLTSSTSATGLNAADALAVPEYLPLDEAHPLFPSDAYGLSKQINEITAAGFGRRSDMHIVCIRPTYILFPELVPHLRGDAVFEGEVPAAFQEAPPVLRTYVDPRDLARCYRLALGYRSTGFDLFWANAADTFETTPTLDYFKSLYGGLPEIRQPELYQRNPHASIIDCSKAQRLLNWVPETSWELLSGCRR